MARRRSPAPSGPSPASGGTASRRRWPAGARGSGARCASRSSGCARSSRSAPSARSLARPSPATSRSRRRATAPHKLRDRMAHRRLHRIAALCALALLAAGALSACGKQSNKPGETVREGLSTPLGGLRYTVFLTRELNLRNEEDSGYLPGVQEAPPKKGWYAVFLEACNKGKREAVASSSFFITDTQGGRFE